MARLPSEGCLCKEGKLEVCGFGAAGAHAAQGARACPGTRGITRRDPASIMPEDPALVMLWPGDGRSHALLSTAPSRWTSVGSRSPMFSRVLDEEQPVVELESVSSWFACAPQPQTVNLLYQKASLPET